MDAFSHLDFLSVGIAVAGIVLLGFVILFNNTRSATNRAFFFFAMVTACWSIANYSYYQFPASNFSLWLLRFVMFLATWHAYTFFNLACIFPSEKAVRSSLRTYVLIPLAGAISLLTLSPYVFLRITAIGANGSISGVENGPAIALFGMFVCCLIVSGVWQLGYKTVRAPKQQRRPYSLMLAGMTITFVLLLTFNFLIPAFSNNSKYIPFGAYFLLPFVMMTSYSIYRHHLFKLKVAGTAFFCFMLTVFSIANILYATQLSGVIVNIIAFFVVLLGSIRIVQDTLNLEKLTEELAQTNERQETLIHFVGHEVKGFLTKDINVLASLSDGDFGALPDVLKPLVVRALADSRQNVESVSSILKASNIKKGTVSYAMEPFDFKAVAEEVVEKAKAAAEQKKLELTFSADEAGAPYTCNGDKEQIASHVLRNLVDNAINYTPSGSVAVSLKKENGKIMFAVKDTGIGITEEDKKKLFTEGGHGKDSQKINVHSTGYGLFIAKSIAEAHHGTIRAESEGEGKGSVFTAEFPA